MFPQGVWILFKWSSPICKNNLTFLYDKLNSIVATNIEFQRFICQKKVQNLHFEEPVGLWELEAHTAWPQCNI